MFRLGYKLTRFHVAIANSSSNLLVRRECPFCKNLNLRLSQPQVVYHNDNFCGRMYLSTRTRLHEKAQKKVKRKRTVFQKYVELIQISDKHPNANLEKKAKIKKSSAANTLKQFGVSERFSAKETIASTSISSQDKTAPVTISQVEESPNVELDSISADEANVSNLERDEDADWEQEISNELIRLEENKSYSNHDLDDTLETKIEAPLKQKEMYDKPFSANDAVDKFSIRNRIQKDLLSFIDVCAHSYKIPLASEKLHYFHKKLKLENTPLNDIRIYNRLLEEWAALGNFNQLSSLFDLMINGNIQPNLQSYACALECAYRSKNYSKVDIILRKIESSGLDINNILLDCNFVRDQRDIVLKAVRLNVKDFNPTKREKPLEYVCNLLQDLNKKMPQERFYTPIGLQSVDFDLQKFVRQQIDIEKAGFMTIRRIDLPSNVDKKTKTLRKKLEECEVQWKSTLLSSFEKKKEKLRIQALHKRSRRTDLLPYLSTLKIEEFVDLMLREFYTISQFSESYSSVMMVLHKNLGLKVMQRYFLHKKMKNGVFQQTVKFVEEFCKYVSDPKLTSQFTPREYWELLKEKYADGPDIEMRDYIWPVYVLVGVGEFLYKIIQKDMKIDLNALKYTTKTEGNKFVPAFYTVYRKHDVCKIREEIKPHPGLSKFFKLAKHEDLIFEANLLPMVCPPVPWTSVENGGFIFAKTRLIRTPWVTNDYQSQRLEEMNIQNIYPCLDSLNCLGECPWIINKPILDLAIQVFKNKGSEELDIPQPMSECPSLPKFAIDMTKEEFTKVKTQRQHLKQQKGEMHSLWCDMLYKLSIANEFRDKVFWFPHNIDFRGRTYPCPPHFNHLGNDVSRSILLFAKGEPLGKNGFDWLKIHLVNLTGHKKRCSLKDRLEYCNEMMPEILDSADNPLNGNGWWKKSDEPWQTLACCMELVKILKSPDPTSYVCHFPVHQDGSCNGLQHYAALGRDVEGADQVNLQPNNTPQDVYSKIAEMIEIERKKDAAEGVLIAQVLDGFISRKVIKQPVMTTVYGVTRYGAREQIQRQLKEIPNFPKDQIFRASGYLVEKTFYSLRCMFSATKEIQDWFTISARLITQLCKQPMEWVTPIGLPIVQPYYKLVRSKNEMKKKKKMKAILTEEVPNVRKQANAFPPNYIHSLDSTHMMLTSLFCQRYGITFVSVHDCFWTHPNSLEEMNTICREQFVALHSEPLLEMLSEFLVKKYCGLEPDRANEKLNKLLSSVPEKGLFDLRKVLNSTYFFS